MDTGITLEDLEHIFITGFNYSPLGRRVFGKTESVTFRNEQRKGKHGYWYAYRKIAGRTFKVYVGTSKKMTLDAVRQAAKKLGIS